MRARIRLALAWANRSTWRAVLTLVIAGLRAIRAGALVTSVRRISTRGLRSTHASSSGDPNRKDAVIGTSRSKAPACSRASTLSENISVQTRRPRRAVSPRSVASGTAPIPACSVEPSRTRVETWCPIVAESSSATLTGAGGSGPSASTTRSM